ncbi:MAG: YoaK family protein, partial [Acidimicrobiia bacterium]
AAGSVDAISYLGLDHVFPAMMTGNTVLLGLAIGQGEVLAALRSILALLGFCAGVAIGALIVERGEKQGDWSLAVTQALVLEAVLLGIFSVTWHLSGTARDASAVHLMILLSAIAMGIQAAAVRHLGVPGIATTYITGTLTSLVVDLVGWVRSAFAPRSPRTAAGAKIVDAPSTQWEGRVGLLAGVFFMYAFGAMAGAIMQAGSSSFATLPPLAAVALVVLNASLRYRNR